MLPVQVLLEETLLLFGKEQRIIFPYSKIHLEQIFTSIYILLLSKMENTFMIWCLQVLMRYDFTQYQNTGVT